MNYTIIIVRLRNDLNQWRDELEIVQGLVRHISPPQQQPDEGALTPSHL